MRSATTTTTWRLPGAEIVDLALGHGITANQWSPLPPPGPRAQRKTSDDAGLVAAIEQVARPWLEVGLLLSPPYGEGILWLYRGGGFADGELTGHVRDADGSHHLQCVPESEIQDAIRSCMALEQPNDPAPFDLAISPAGYAALLGVIDANRENALSSLLNRSEDADRSLATDLIGDTAANATRTADMRWISCLGVALSPERVPTSEDIIRAGLREIAAQGLVEPDGDAWKLLPIGQALASTFGVPLSWCVLHSRWISVNGESAGHLAFLRGMGSLWSLDFDDRRVRIQGASAEDIELRIGTQFLAWRDPPTTLPDTASTPGAAAAPPKVCSACGTSLRPATRFCQNCGAALRVS